MASTPTYRTSSPDARTTNERQIAATDRRDYETHRASK